MKACSIPDCEKPKYTRGYCPMHYYRWLRHGDPLMTVLGGDDIGYAGAHKRVKRRRGKPSEHPCAHCDRQAKDWAYMHDCPDEKSGITKVSRVMYCLHLEHYIPLCGRCHSRFDRQASVRALISRDREPKEVTFPQ